MCGIHVRLIVRMTGDAAEHLVIARICMAIGTGTPGAVVVSGIDRKIKTVMIECRRDPCILGMTACTVGRKLCSGMGRIGRLVVIVQMAADTGVGSVIVILVMAGIAVVRHGSMGALKYIIVVMDRECGRGPAGFGCMA